MAASGPVSKSKAAATAPDAADAADTSGGGGEGAGVDLGFVLQASADNEEVAPSATRDGGPGPGSLSQRQGCDITYDITM